MPLPVDHLDMMAIAAKHTLRGDPALMAWAENRIVRRPHFVVTDGLPRREIAVAANSEELEFIPGEAAEARLFLGFRIAWQESDRVMEDTESSVSAVATQIRTALRSNYYLVRPETGGSPLVRRLHEFAPVDFDAIELRESKIQMTYTVMAEYRAYLNTQTWEIELA